MNTQSVLTPLNPYTVKNSFNRSAKKYDSVAVLQRKIAENMLTRLEFIKLSPQIIVDIGAGTGYASRLLGKQYKTAQIISLDFAIDMLRMAKKNKKFFSKQKFICADTNRLPFDDHSIDFIFANLMLHWSADLNNTLREWQRILKPNGLLMFTMFGPDTLKELRQSWAEVDGKAHVHTFLDVHDIGDKLLHSGLADPVLDIEYFQLTYNSTMQLMQELKMLGIHNLSENRQRGLTTKRKLTKMQQSYQQFKLADDRYPATYEVIYGHAWGKNLTNVFGATKSEISIPVSKILIKSQ